MTFEHVAKSRRGAGTSQPEASIYPSGRFRLNAAAVREWFDDVDAVEFYVDDESDRLGVARGGSDEDAYPLTFGEHGGAEISFRTVLGRLGIDIEDLDETVHLDLEHDHDEGLIVSDLAPLYEEAGRDE